MGDHLIYCHGIGFLVSVSTVKVSHECLVIITIGVFLAIISRFTLKSTAVSLQARRLINQVNWCYVNATLQALLACPPFYHALKALPSYPPLSHNQKSSTPVLDAM